MAGAVFGFVSLSTLTAMSIERYLVVSNPLGKYSNYIKKSN